MTSYPCARCNHDTDNDDIAAEHALASGHLRCIVCRRRSHTQFEQQTCVTCIAAVRVDLADLIADVAFLEPVTTAALTLLGDGTMQRLPHAYEVGTWHREPEKQIRDEWPSDPLPVLPALASWEDMIRAEYRDVKGAVPATLSATVDYLTRNLDTGHRLAQTFHAFDELAWEIRRHRSTIRHIAGLADDPEEADPECFDCGGQLLRHYRPPLTPVETPRKGLPAEGLADEWVCAWCRRVYDQSAYHLALRAKASSWVGVRLAADTAQRSQWTVWSWVRRLQVTSACRVSDHAVLVWWPDVSDRAFRHAELSA